MVRLPMMPELLRQLFKKPATNAFPARYLPPSVTKFLQKVAQQPQFGFAVFHDQDVGKTIGVHLGGPSATSLPRFRQSV